MPENTKSTISVAAGHTEGVCLISNAPARVESRIPIAYRLIRRGYGNGNSNMLPILQGFFTWSEGAMRGAEWRDLETQEEPYIEDRIPFGQISW